MPDFQTAINWLKEGKKVRRPCWREDSYWAIGIDETIIWNGVKIAHIHLNQINADDWEIFQEEKKLKTLQDVEIDYRKRFEEKGIHQPGGGLSNDTQRYWFRNGYKVSFEYFPKEVKAEAIKWVKELQMGYFDKKKIRNEEMERAVKEWIKHFFNITEEDLKNA